MWKEHFSCQNASLDTDKGHEVLQMPIAVLLFQSKELASIPSEGPGWLHTWPYPLDLYSPLSEGGEKSQSL